MTTLYKPVLIESAAQAEALPVGTVIECTGGLLVDVAPHRKVAPGEWFGGNGRVTTGDLHIGASEAIRSEWTALVPIEAEGETHGYIKYGRFGGEDSAGTRTRLVPPWEEA